MTSLLLAFGILLLSAAPAHAATQTPACSRIVCHAYSSSGECMNYTCYQNDGRARQTSSPSCPYHGSAANRGNRFYADPSFDPNYYGYEDDYYYQRNYAPYSYGLSYSCSDRCYDRCDSRYRRDSRYEDGYDSCYSRCFDDCDRSWYYQHRNAKYQYGW